MKRFFAALVALVFSVQSFAQQATRARVTALSSNSLTAQFLPQNFPIKTVSWSGNQTLTVTGGSLPRGSGLVIEATVTAAMALTVTPTIATVYRNGSTSSLAS